MKPTQNSVGRPPLWARLVGTTAGCGYWPWGPGTMGAIAGVAIWVALAAVIHSVPAIVAIISALIVIFTVLGVAAADCCEKYWGPDPSRVVMDETVGQWITMLPLSPLVACAGTLGQWSTWGWVALSLALFRFFDIVKPLGVRRMEALPGGRGVMADDILAGIYGAIILLILRLI